MAEQEVKDINSKVTIQVKTAEELTLDEYDEFVKADREGKVSKAISVVVNSIKRDGVVVENYGKLTLAEARGVYKTVVETLSPAAPKG